MTANLEMSCASNDDFVTVPRDESGDFLSTQIDWKTHVQELTPESKQRTIFEDGTTAITQRSVMTPDGRRYIVSSSDPRGETDNILPVSYLETTAWLTQPEGMYTRRLINLGRLGIAGTVVSAPQNIGKVSSLERNARNVLTIGKYEALRKRQDSRFVVITGESRGSMIGIPEIRFADEYDMTPLFVHLDAPCIPRGLVEAMTENGTLPCGKNIGRQAVKAISQEIMTLNKAIDNDKRANRHMGKTLDVSRRSPLIHAQEGMALLTGDAGRHAQHLPDTTFGHVGLAADDALSNPQAWEQIFASYDGITTIKETSGGHLSTIGRVFHEGWLRNMTCVRDVLVSHPEFTSSAAHQDPRATVLEFSQYYSQANPLYSPLTPLPSQAA